ncbi:uncharacterized protein LOC124455738 [Xenia sp. Carnegie-2017]|uniref:uncharacterized protein LOC124455738 n=1 Tax=Xenia sp. Carnegie-2017 TaxID=2897299 RepID=UPI001F042B26|nr:uncharacterized protein LOC124455738 [Xenia sp. Carnegie-2017]
MACFEDGKYLIENVLTKRYLFSAGDKIEGNRGDEGGWLSSPNCVGADANYDNRAYWKFVPRGNGKYFIENLKTERYLFQNGNKIKGDRGAEGGWTSNPGFGVPLCVGSDANYFDRAYWKLEPQGEDRYFIVNVQTQRYLLQEGSKIEGNRGDEGGWLKAPKCIGTDANYYNRAFWKILKQ